MEDRDVYKLIKSLDTKAIPPEGLKNKIFRKAVSENQETSGLTPFERFVFESPLRVACVISLCVSGSLWAVFGSNFSKLLVGIMG